jgi:periplasmic divalent cation tolerance protein
MATDAVVVLTTAPPGEAAHIARQLVLDRLAACVQLAGIRSFYRWQGRIEDEPEELLLIKTRTSLAEAVIARIREVHSYEVPEAVVLPIAEASGPYLEWLMTETSR